ncbi:MAG: type II secretion system F family protein [Aquabacterium sp.]
MVVASLVLFFVAIMLMLAAVLSVLRARRVDQIQKVNERLEAIAFLSDKPVAGVPAGLENEAEQLLTRWLGRVGFKMSAGTALVALVALVMVGVLIFKTWGLLAAMAWWGLASLVSVLIPQVIYRQKVNKLVSQIPLFIDQVIRAMVTGRNVEGAVKLATEDTKEPLREIIVRAQNNVELGADLGDALRDAAEFHDIKELHMLALAVHTSRVYGGSPRDMLESIVNLIRQREQMQRELRALTGETRISAWVLGLLPTFIAGYMWWVNPDYIAAMWRDPSGQNILITSLTLQALGGLVLWRMVKSV